MSLVFVVLNLSACGTLNDCGQSDCTVLLFHHNFHLSLKFLSNFLIEMLVAAVFPLTAPDRFLHYNGPNSPPTHFFHVVFLMISNYRHKIQVMAGLHFLLDKLCT